MFLKLTVPRVFFSGGVFFPQTPVRPRFVSGSPLQELPRPEAAHHTARRAGIGERLVCLRCGSAPVTSESYYVNQSYSSKGI